MATITGTLTYGSVSVPVAIVPTTIHVELRDVTHGTVLGTLNDTAGIASVVFSNITVPPDGMDVVATISNLDQSGALIGSIVSTPVLNFPATIHTVSVVVSGVLAAS